MRVILLFLSLTIVSCTKVNAKIISFGEIKASETIGKAASKNSHTGYVHLMHQSESPVFSQQEHVKAKIGKRFGINVLVSGGKFGQIVNLITRVTHPPFSSGETIDQWDSPMNFNVTRFTGWLFESEDELRAGKWKFEILDQEQNILASKEFNITVER